MSEELLYGFACDSKESKVGCCWKMESNIARRQYFVIHFFFIFFFFFFGYYVHLRRLNWSVCRRERERERELSSVNGTFHCITRMPLRTDWIQSWASRRKNKLINQNLMHCTIPSKKRSKTLKTSVGIEPKYPGIVIRNADHSATRLLVFCFEFFYILI